MQRGIQELLLRKFLKPQIASDIPGRLRVRFSKHKLLPKAAYPYMHYAQEAIALLPGVTNVSLNVYTGSILIEYNKEETSSSRVLAWINRIVDVGINSVKSFKGDKIPSEQEIYEEGKKILLKELSSWRRE